MYNCEHLTYICLIIILLYYCDGIFTDIACAARLVIHLYISSTESSLNRMKFDSICGRNISSKKSDRDWKLI